VNSIAATAADEKSRYRRYEDGSDTTTPSLRADQSPECTDATAIGTSQGCSALLRSSWTDTSKKPPYGPANGFGLDRFCEKRRANDLAMAVLRGRSPSWV
jgi:hypothetical protein